MTKKWLSVFIGLNRYNVLLIGVILLQSFSIKAQVIELATGEWPPYLSAKLPHQGYVSHIVESVFNEMGYAVKYVYYPWARAESLVKNGKVSGSIIWSNTLEREKFAWFSEPVVTLQSVAFHHKKQPLEWQTITDFEGERIALPLGSSRGIWQPLINAKKMTLIRTVDIETGFKMLLKDRVDILSLSKEVGYYALRNTFSAKQIEQITHHPKPLKALGYGLMLSKQQPENHKLIESFNRQLQRFAASGQLSKMQKAFYAGDYDTVKSTSH